MFDKETKTGKLFSALVEKNQALTTTQITKRFGIKDPSSAVSKIRFAGYPVYTNVSKTKEGKRVTEYRHGKASRKLIAAGYKAMAAGLVPNEQR
jgi:hypothetical protein